MYKILSWILGGAQGENGSNRAGIIVDSAVYTLQGEPPTPPPGPKFLGRGN